MAASSPGALSRASAHSVAQAGGARSQFFSSAGVSARGGGAGVAGAGGGVLLQPASTPRIAATALQSRRGAPMVLLLLEALLALGLLVFIVWWVMFAGRRKGERDDGEPKA